MATEREGLAGVDPATTSFPCAGHSPACAAPDKVALPQQTQYPYQDSNLGARLRRPLLYPLSYRGGGACRIRTDVERGCNPLPSHSAKAPWWEYQGLNLGCPETTALQAAERSVAHYSLSLQVDADSNIACRSPFSCCLCLCDMRESNPPFADHDREPSHDGKCHRVPSRT